MGLLGYWFSSQAIFFASAAFAVLALVALGRIRAHDIHFARACGATTGDYHPARSPRSARAAIGTNYWLIFASCIFLFQLANASALPLISEQLGRDHGSSLVTSALIVVPQIVVSILAPRVGRKPIQGRKLRSAGAMSAQNGQLMLKSDKLEFERGAAAKAENEERYNG